MATFNYTFYVDAQGEGAAARTVALVVCEDLRSANGSITFLPAANGGTNSSANGNIHRATHGDACRVTYSCKHECTNSSANGGTHNSAATCFLPVALPPTQHGYPDVRGARGARQRGCDGGAG